MSRQINIVVKISQKNKHFRNQSSKWQWKRFVILTNLASANFAWLVAIHFSETCENKLCEISYCLKRHPTTCKYFKIYNRCKFGSFCFFKHKTNDGLSQNNDDEIEICYSWKPSFWPGSWDQIRRCQNQETRRENWISWQKS